ncbi:hypothetical protein NKH44_27085 [Mesorhizobium sp. M1121]
MWRRDHPCRLSADPARQHQAGRPGPPRPRA